MNRSTRGCSRRWRHRSAAYAIPAYHGETDRHALPPFRPWQQTKALLAYTARQKTIFQCILAISWFWLLGGALLTQIPQYAKEVLNSGPEVTTYLLVLFSVGIGVGSLLSNLLARGRIEAGLVPVGAFILAAGLAGVITISANPAITEAQTLAAFWHDPRFVRTTLAFFAIAFGGGIYAVPLYAIIQHRAESGHKSQMIAANNIINALFLVIVSLLGVLVLGVLGWSMQALFALLLGLHLAISLYIFTVVPEFIMRCLVILIIACCYRRGLYRLQPPELHGRADSHGRHPPPGALHHVLQDFPNPGTALHLQKRRRIPHRRTTRRPRAVPRLL